MRRAKHAIKIASIGYNACVTPAAFVGASVWLTGELSSVHLQSWTNFLSPFNFSNGSNSLKDAQHFN